MVGTSGTKELKSSWPFTSGLTAGTTSQTGHQENLVPEESSIIPKREIIGI